jgi:hypothetical protein
MATPTKKTKAIADLLEEMTGRIAAINDNVCVSPPYGCGQFATGFRDQTSRREFSISGLCQACQDSVFGE